MKAKYTSRQRLTFTIMAAILAALTFVTISLTAVPIPIIGIFHIGDFFIYIAATLLPLPYAMAVGAIGGGLTNITASHLILFTPFTVVIKSLNCLPFGSKDDKILTKRNIHALFISGGITIVGYFFARLFVRSVESGNFYVGLTNAFWGILSNVGQAVGSAIIFLIVASLLDKAKIKKLLY